MKEFWDEYSVPLLFLVLMGGGMLLIGLLNGWK